jgi:hypothetical protein
MYPTLQYVVHIFSSNIFRYAHSPFCEVLSFNTLRHCNFESKTLRKKACAFFYLLIKKNLAEMKNFSKMKLLSTVAISKLMGITGPQDFSLMTKSLLAIAQFANGDPTNSTSISAQVAELTNRLKSISQNSTKISQNSHDPEMLAGRWKRYLLLVLLLLTF